MPRIGGDLARWAHPVLPAVQTAEFERRLFAGDEKCEWAAMQAAGRAVAAAVWRDFSCLGERAVQELRLLVLAGKGHNGGDALIATEAILAGQPTAQAEVFLVYGMRALRPLAWQAWVALQNRFPERVRAISARDLAARVNGAAHYALCLDGIFGLKFRRPVDARAAAALAAVNALSIDLRAAVDLPSGLMGAARADFGVTRAAAAESADFRSARADFAAAENPFFHADFTYATGVLKREVLGRSEAGRVRYLDLGFFKRGLPPPFPHEGATADRVLTAAVLAPLRAWRDPQTHKGREGHVFVLAGSREYPGAALMCVLAALRSGAGLVTGFVPESLVTSFAAQVPEAMWVGWPETDRGGLALEGRHLLRGWIERAAGGRSAGGVSLVVGPGIGRERETQVLVSEVVNDYGSRLPLLLDADALQPELIEGAKCPLVLTPHAGEFKRIARAEATDAHLREFAKRTGATVVLKGPVTRICAGGATGAATDEYCPRGPALEQRESGSAVAGGMAERAPRSFPCQDSKTEGVSTAGKGRDPCRPLYPDNRTGEEGNQPLIIHSLFGGHVLARGGSGDLLAGMIGTQLAKYPDEARLQATCRAVAWHGFAAEALACTQNPESTLTTQLLNHL